MTARERLQRHFLIIGVLIFVAGLFLASGMLRDQTDHRFHRQEGEERIPLTEDARH